MIEELVACVAANRFDPIFHETNGVAEFDFARSVVTLQDASISNGSAFDQASWTKTETTASADQDGTADKITVNAAATTPLVTQTVSNSGVNATRNPPMIFVVDVKSTDVTWVLIETRSGTAANRTWFRIDGSPSVGTNGASHSGATNTDGGSGYRRLTLTMDANGGTAIFSIRLVNADNSLTTSGDGTSVLLKNASVTQNRFSTITNRKTGSSSLTQGTAGLQPGYSATGFNGGPCGLGYGFQYLIGSEASVVAALAGTDLAYTVFYAVQYTNPDHLGSVFGSGDSGVATNRTRLWGSSTNAAGEHRDAAVDDGGTTLVGVSTGGGIGTNAKIVEVFNSGTACSIKDNGAAADPNATAHNGTAVTSTRYALFCRPDSTPDNILGVSPGAGSKVAVIQIYSAEKNSASRSRIRVNLGARKGVTVTP